MLLSLYQFVIALSAEGLVLLEFAEHHLLLASHNAVADVGQIAAAHADGVDFRHVLGNGAELGHGTEGIALEVHVETGNDDALAGIGQLVADVDESFVEELRLIDAHHVGLGREEQNGLAVLDGRRDDGVGVVAHHLVVAVAGVDDGFIDFNFLACYACTVHATQQFLRLSGEHASADDFNASALGEYFVVRHGEEWFGSLEVGRFNRLRAKGEGKE